MRPRAKKSLGQHFLVDENFLGVIDRLAELEPEDVVLEIGPGTGVLTRHLADSVGEVHTVELDESRTCPTTSRRPSSSRASSGSRRSSGGS